MMPKQKLKMISEGIFFSLLNYCIEVYGNVWGLYPMMTRSGTALLTPRKLQILVNKVLRSLTVRDRDTPVTVLHDQSGQLPVHQGAIHTLTTVHKAVNQKLTPYTYSKLKPNQGPLDGHNNQ